MRLDRLDYGCSLKQGWQNQQTRRPQRHAGASSFNAKTNTNTNTNKNTKTQKQIQSKGDKSGRQDFSV